jgi:hypothetical protein
VQVTSENQLSSEEYSPLFTDSSKLNTNNFRRKHAFEIGEIKVEKEFVDPNSQKGALAPFHKIPDVLPFLKKEGEALAIEDEESKSGNEQ